MVLLLQGVLFVGLARTLDKPVLFLIVYCLLMFVNAAWLGQVVYRTTLRDKETKKVGFETMFFPPENNYLVAWIVNNGVAVLFLAALIITAIHAGWDSPLGIICSIVGLIWCFINSIFDFVMTWKYYFPYRDAGNHDAVKRHPPVDLSQGTQERAP